MRYVGQIFLWFHIFFRFTCTDTSLALNVNAEANIRRWPECPLTIYYALDPAQSALYVHYVHCAVCALCTICALGSVCTVNYMCMPWTRKCVHRVANSFWHVAVCAESSPQLCIPEILENFQSRASWAPERTCFFWLHWALKRMYVWVNGTLHFDLMINISWLINGH